MIVDELYMRRALQLAANGRGFTSPNPMVGAVIVAPDGRVIGEGWHRRCGEAHAEVNAVASVAEVDKPLLRESTIYVTLEPCSHYGKTPPCAKLIIDVGIPRVVVGATDPFEKVSGRGVAMLRQAGVEVVTGVLEAECRRLNRRFFTAHTLHRPYITLKWACSADGFMDHVRTADNPQAARFSTPLTSVEVMKLRSLNDAIITTASTVLADKSQLTVRSVGFRRNPDVFILDRQGRLSGSCSQQGREALKRLECVGREVYVMGNYASLGDLVDEMYARNGVTSALVEAGPTLLQAFIDADLYDEVHIETAPMVLGAAGMHPAPVLNFEAQPNMKIEKVEAPNGAEITTIYRAAL